MFPYAPLAFSICCMCLILQALLPRYVPETFQLSFFSPNTGAFSLVPFFLKTSDSKLRNVLNSRKKIFKCVLLNNQGIFYAYACPFSTNTFGKCMNQSSSSYGLSSKGNWDLLP